MDFVKNLQCFLSFLSLLLIENVVYGFQYDYVTCGSTLKIYNSYHNVRLHSHDVKYGSGSGQQSVTAVESSDDHNSYWQVKAKTGAQCIRGQPIKCGQTIRLMHLQTRRNLHSHHFGRPLSHNLEVSAFGEAGDGDEGDNWSIVCSGKYWNRKDKVRIKNVVTEYYLHVTGDTYGRPIKNQREVCGYSSPNELNYWQAMEGVFVTPSEDPQGTFRGDLNAHQHAHTEL
ncbi:LOW QUALITY PROTEIN: stromal cell-derived factor 2-like [Ruditapes philippinarum]|uniref:LOW QUALITY PROTEIN: stromal cell-derived factor 2-like n=1 Tax=Ruditapes philippinarum TaxID=129788 RepID=UPI00295BCF14|nr:LOW QUALITY PROTEIN: stromal cell-derived factor 2-like [Ruditapes philippinarum]